MLCCLLCVAAVLINCFISVDDDTDDTDDDNGCGNGGGNGGGGIDSDLSQFSYPHHDENQDVICLNWLIV